MKKMMRIIMVRKTLTVNKVKMDKMEYKSMKKATIMKKIVMMMERTEYHSIKKATIIKKRFIKKKPARLQQVQGE